MKIRLSARIGAFACLGVAATMAVLALREEPKPLMQPITAVMAPSANPLRAKLADCQLEGQAAASDASCLAAWAENRRRFLGESRNQSGWQPTPATSADPAAQSEEK